MKHRIAKFVKPAQRDSGQQIHIDDLPCDDDDDDSDFVQHKSNPDGNCNVGESVNDPNNLDLSEPAGGSVLYCIVLYKRFLTWPK